MPTIVFDHDDFPAGVLPASAHQLTVTWDEILWAAITVGRPDLYHVFEHGDASIYEAFFRWSMIRMALEQHGPTGTRLYRTGAFKHMDPTEKGAVNYFLGLVFCKLFAAKLLNAPWTLHLDVWRQALNPILLSGRSRPDMVAQSSLNSQWHAFECKGRASSPGETEKGKAKDQANRIVSVGSTNCTLHVGSITYYRNDVLQFYWRDPAPNVLEPLRIPRPGEAWREYYQPFTQAYRSYDMEGVTTLSPEGAVRIKELDLTLKIYPPIAELLMANDWQGARRRSRESRAELNNSGYQPDGLKVIAGESWLSRFQERRPRG